MSDDKGGTRVTSLRFSTAATYLAVGRGDGRIDVYKNTSAAEPGTAPPRYTDNPYFALLVHCRPSLRYTLHNPTSAAGSADYVFWCKFSQHASAVRSLDWSVPAPTTGAIESVGMQPTPPALPHRTPPPHLWQTARPPLLERACPRAGG